MAMAFLVAFIFLRALCFALAGLLLSLSMVQASEAEMQQKNNTRSIQVALLQGTGHGISQEIERGFKDRLAKSQTVALKLYTYTAKGKLENTQTIAQLLSHKDLDLILSIGVAATQTAILASKFRAAQDPEHAAAVPLIFTAVGDPFHVNILARNQTAEGIYGVQAAAPIKEQVQLIRSLMPELERLGIVYSADEVSTIKTVEDLKDIAEVFEIQVVSLAVTSLEGVAPAYLELGPKVDAFFMPLDNKLLPQVELIVALANQAGVPVFASDSLSVQRGALAALGYDYYEGGLLAADVALAILDKQAQSPGVQLIQQKQRLTLNRKTARSLRIVFPASAISQADRIVD
jgi:putative tryptophan/tyrosine transport system substrate-binding protein